MPDPSPIHVQVVELLRSGYGVEDIAVKTNRPVSSIRELVQAARERGTIYDLLGTDPARNAEALRIMGVRNA